MHRALRLILLFVAIIAGQMTLYAGRRSRKTIFKSSDYRSFSPEGRKRIKKERQQKEQRALDRNISSTQAQEEKIKKDVALAEQTNVEAEQRIRKDIELAPPKVESAPKREKTPEQTKQKIEAPSPTPAAAPRDAISDAMTKEEIDEAFIENYKQLKKMTQNERIEVIREQEKKLQNPHPNALLEAIVFQRALLENLKKAFNIT